MTAECIHRAGAVLAEGPVWHGGRLWWVDIERREIHVLDVENGTDRKWTLPTRVGFAVPRAGGGFVIGTECGLATWDENTGAQTPLDHPEKDKPGNRFNDAKCDPEGRLWAGTMAMSEIADQGALYRADSRGIVRVVDNVSISNGLAWSPDGTTMYYIDSPTRRVDAFDFRAGEVSNRRTVITLTDGFPDGMCADADGNLWIALWGGWAVACHDPRTGQRIAKIEVPVEAVTSCCFGDDTELFITTASRDLDAAGHERQPLAGGIFRADTGVRGMPVTTFIGGGLL
jgi:sugar lactone lactonase YvrE